MCLVYDVQTMMVEAASFVVSSWGYVDAVTESCWGAM
jgi:hypothetical protein